jgi:uncharacterized protein YdaU (DUF1376 family)
MENKLPTFRFYANDFLGSTAEMELESIGAYIKLLCYEWIWDLNKGGTNVSQAT